MTIVGKFRDSSAFVENFIEDDIKYFDYSSFFQVFFRKSTDELIILNVYRYLINGIYISKILDNFTTRLKSKLAKV